MDAAIVVVRSTLNLILYLLVSIYYALENLVLAFVPQKYMFKDISNETVLITGGGNGIGKELAREFSKLAAKLILLDIRLDDLRETAKWLKREGAQSDIYIFECDISKRELVYTVANKIQREIGTVTMLINNAGIVNGKSFLDLKDESISKTMEVNALAHIWTCKAFLPNMLKRNHGHIVSISSLAGYTAAPNLTDYCASKYAVVGFLEALRLELKKDNFTGVKISIVAPYHINTKLFEGTKFRLIDSYSPQFAAKEILSGVLMNKDAFSVPTFFMLATWIPACFPRKAIREIQKVFGLDTYMDNFKGRNN